MYYYCKNCLIIESTSRCSKCKYSTYKLDSCAPVTKFRQPQTLQSTSTSRHRTSVSRPKLHANEIKPLVDNVITLKRQNSSKFDNRNSAFLKGELIDPVYNVENLHSLTESPDGDYKPTLYFVSEGNIYHRIRQEHKSGPKLKTMGKQRRAFFKDTSNLNNFFNKWKSLDIEEKTTRKFSRLCRRFGYARIRHSITGLYMLEWAYENGKIHKSRGICRGKKDINLKEEELISFYPYKFVFPITDRNLYLLKFHCDSVKERCPLSSHGEHEFIFQPENKLHLCGYCGIMDRSS